MDPPRSEFRDRLEECSSLLQTLGTDPQVQRLSETLKQIQNRADDAYATKNQRNWSIVNDNIAKLRAKLENIGTGGDGGQKRELPPVWQLKDHFELEVDQLRAALKSKRSDLERSPDYDGMWRGLCDDIDRTLDQMEIAISKVDEEIESSQAMAQLQLATRRKDKLAGDIRKLGEQLGKG